MPRRGATNVTLEAPGAGTYAIVIYHDENANTDMDTTFIGYPTEGFGFSNNPKLFLAPPSHDEAAFEVAEATARSWRSRSPIRKKAGR